MKQEEIDKKLAKEQSDFYNAKFKGKLPKDFMEYFKKALFGFAPQAHKISIESLKEWIRLSNAELNFGQVTKMIEVITSAPANTVFSSFEESFPVLIEMEKIFKEAVEKTNEFNHTQQRKRMSMQNMKGVMGGNASQQNKSKKQAPAKAV